MGCILDDFRESYLISFVIKTVSQFCGNVHSFYFILFYFYLSIHLFFLHFFPYFLCSFTH